MTNGSSHGNGNTERATGVGAEHGSKPAADAPGSRIQLEESLALYLTAGGFKDAPQVAREVVLFLEDAEALRR